MTAAKLFAADSAVARSIGTSGTAADLASSPLAAGPRMALSGRRVTASTGVNPSPASETGRGAGALSRRQPAAIKLRQTIRIRVALTVWASHLGGTDKFFFVGASAR